MMMRTLKVFKIMLEKTSSIALISRACEEAERKAQRAHFPDQSQMNHRPFIADRCICFAPEISEGLKAFRPSGTSGAVARDLCSP